MNCPDWLMSLPVAHRGLHDRESGLIENSLSAAAAAVAMRCAIECDVQLSADGEAVVFHDQDLGRLTGTPGLVAARSAAQLGALVLSGSHDGIPTLAALLKEIDGRVPLICEIKSNFDQDTRLTRRAVEVVSLYSGPVAFKSFDPFIVEMLRETAPKHPRGIISQSHYNHQEWGFCNLDALFSMENLSHLDKTRPDFLSWNVNDLRYAAPSLGRSLGRLPVMAWTVRTDVQIAFARLHADQLVFENCLIRPAVLSG